MTEPPKRRADGTEPGGDREVVLLYHPTRPDALAAARVVQDGLERAGLAVRAMSPALDTTTGQRAQVEGAELVVVLGGDGSILTGTELARPHGVPVLGVNLGHVGFLAEAEPEALPEVVRRIVARDYLVEERMTVDVEVHTPDGETRHGWALNEAAVEKGPDGRMVEAALGVDGRGLSTFACDAVVLATPTGSTAYAFSGGGPVVWPGLEALLVVPIAAHALFTRPMVVGPESVLEVEILAEARSSATVRCDGRRTIDAPPGARVEVRRGGRPALLALLSDAPFSGRLVAKFNLPVSGWRGHGTDAAGGRGAHPDAHSGTTGAARPAQAAGGGPGVIERVTISDLGVIASARLDLGPGLTALTGETGAGKTMVLTSLRLLLGHKADSSIVRHGRDSALVEGEWVLPESAPARELAAEAGADVEDDLLVVARSVSAKGRSRAHAGGRTVPATLLADIGDGLVTVHGQADQLRLREPARQRAALDTFGGPEHLELVRAAGRAHAAVLDARTALAERTADEGRRLAEIASLTRVAELVAAADPTPGEDEELRSLSLRLEHAETLRTAAAEARAAVVGNEEDGTPGAAVLLGHAAQTLAAAGGHDPALETLAARAAELGPALSDLGTELTGYLDGLDADPGALDTVHSRRAELGRLARELGVAGVDEALAEAERAAVRLAQIDGPAAEPEALAAAVEQAEETRAQAAADLTASRRAVAERLTAAVDEELRGLAMPGARLGIDLQPLDEPGPHGAEDVLLTLATHPSAPARPLGQAASGGELSRVMLALEVCLAAAAGGESRTFVFDEVDAGVGGRAAVEVGRRLAGLARHHQVVVVTHLAQVAAFAGDHLVVTRGDDGVTDVVPVSGEDRVVELARMLSGQEDSTAARAHAAELLELAGVSP